MCPKIPGTLEKESAESSDLELRKHPFSVQIFAKSGHWIKQEYWTMEQWPFYSAAPPHEVRSVIAGF